MAVNGKPTLARSRGDYLTDTQITEEACRPDCNTLHLNLQCTRDYRGTPRFVSNHRG
ncbi:hypothetical protein RvY_00256 [Ramazzottius varieornatus]|uniref:Uncharacterized protein n=1 Tax=Ramazzottius varieornatus TaxID=947166 RepID=A0A1D1UC57_RAMVA|nr:hypothetical protein RvY_00256 [Ramazzottius varieornatus]